MWTQIIIEIHHKPYLKSSPSQNLTRSTHQHHASYNSTPPYYNNYKSQDDVFFSQLEELFWLKKQRLDWNFWSCSVFWSNLLIYCDHPLPDEPCVKRGRPGGPSGSNVRTVAKQFEEKGCNDENLDEEGQADKWSSQWIRIEGVEESASRGNSEED